MTREAVMVIVMVGWCFKYLHVACDTIILWGALVAQQRQEREHISLRSSENPRLARSECTCSCRRHVPTSSGGNFARVAQDTRNVPRNNFAKTVRKESSNVTGISTDDAQGPSLASPPAVRSSIDSTMGRGGSPLP